DGELSNERGQDIEVKVRRDDAAKPACLVHKRGSARNTGYTLVVEDVRRHPNQSAGGLRFRVERADSRIVAAFVFPRPTPSTVLQNLVLERRRFSVHNSSLSDSLLTIRSIGTREKTRFIAVADPTEAPIA